MLNLDGVNAVLKRHAPNIDTKGFYIRDYNCNIGSNNYEEAELYVCLEMPKTFEKAYGLNQVTVKVGIDIEDIKLLYGLENC